MSDKEELLDDLPTFLARHPTLQYVLLAGLGILGVYASAPIDFAPQSTVEWLDLIINVVILIPSSMLLGAGTVLAVLSALSPRTLNEDSRPARFTRLVLQTVGFPREIVPTVAVLGPLGLLLEIFWDKWREDASDQNDPGEDQSESPPHQRSACETR